MSKRKGLKKINDSSITVEMLKTINEDEFCYANILVNGRIELKTIVESKKDEIIKQVQRFIPDVIKTIVVNPERIYKKIPR